MGDALPLVAHLVAQRLARRAISPVRAARPEDDPALVQVDDAAPEDVLVVTADAREALRRRGLGQVEGEVEETARLRIVGRGSTTPRGARDGGR